jgi:hypothetical protein
LAPADFAPRQTIAPAHLEVRLRGLQGLRELVRRRMTACAIASGVIAIT